MSLAPHDTLTVQTRIPFGLRAADMPARALPSGEEMVELELGEGLSLFTRADELASQLDIDSNRDTGAQSIRLHSHARVQRGGADLVVHALKVLGVDVDGWLGPAKSLAADLIAARVAELIDARRVDGRAGLGLYRCSAQGPYSSAEAGDRLPSADGEMLVLLHGFCSSTAGSFGNLWQSAGRPTLEALRRRYGEAIYCFDHRTLGEGPIANALALAQQLPEGSKLHLLAFSRGGLIGELLSRVQSADGHPVRDSEYLRLERRHPQDGAALRELIRTLQDKRIQVTRFVRVATPARGTWLASNRLDRWLSIFYNVARVTIPDGPQMLADHVFDVLAAVIRKRLEARHFPGIEAMRPDSELMALLNDVPPRLDQRLTVIGGDCVGHGILHRLKLLITDGFFGEPHDLVVPTASMFGGAARTGGLRYFFHQTARVDHFQYFDQAESLERIRIGLVGDEAQYATLQHLDRVSQRPELTPNRAVRPDAPVNLILPGIMGTGLAYQHDDQLWVDMGEFAFGNFSRLLLGPSDHESDYPSPGTQSVYPGEPLDYWPVNFYGHLMSALRRRGELVEPAGFDWRKPIHVAADALARKIEAVWPAGSPRPLRLIAHSMGGLVVRMMFARHPALRARFERSGANRFLMLGTPNAGSLAVARAMLGDNPLIDKIDCLAPQSETELLTITGSFPGFLELLPTSGRDWSQQAVWDQLFDLRNRPPRQRPVLAPAACALAAKGRAALVDAGASLPMRNTVYVAGFVDPAAADATIVDIDPEGRYVHGAGDGTVPYASGLIPGIDTYYVNASHGDLPAHKPAFAGYFELLDRGQTDLLSRDWKHFQEARRGVVLGAYTRSELPYRPTRGEIYSALLGMSPQPPDDILPSRQRPILVRMVNGGIRFARYSTIVGHYQGDTMGGSERDLNRLFAGQLRTALELGVYPGAIETFQVFNREQEAPDKRSPSAVIVGLGRAGELSVGELRRCVRRGLLGWFGTAAGTVRGSPRRGSFSIVLLGTSVSGMSVAECARAILQGAADAQQVLADRLRPDGSQAEQAISELELVEIYEDRALELAAELPALLNDREFRDRFALRPKLERRDDALRRLRDGARSNTMIRRLDIRALSGGRLRYSLPGIQAAVPLLKRNIDIAEILTYAREVDRNLSSDPRVGRVLFNQLLPLELKRFALEQYDLLLVLNQAAAGIAWELADAGSEVPLSVQSGMIRQLRRSTYRPRERVSQDTALVIGEPDVPGLPRLPGARREASAVADALRAAGFEVHHLDRPSAMEVRDALSSRRAYRIVHFAGHGVMDYRSPLAEPDCPPRTGMVIGSLPLPADPQPASVGSAGRPQVTAGDAPGGSHWLLLTPDDVRECMVQVPELVFINCCHLGRQSGLAQDAPKLASNLANSFMDMGCRAVVAAGWAVEDDAATCFAQTFYRWLVGRGASYIQSVRQARKDTFDQHGSTSPTWGAYQCYGDPNYQALRGDRETAPREFATERELEYWLRDRCVQAMAMDTCDAAGASETIGKVLDANPRRWRFVEETFLQAVRAYESVGANERALELIDQRARARRSQPGSIWGTRARLQLRIASQAATDDPPARAVKMAQAREGLQQLRLYAELDGSDANWFALGTYCRRWFLLHPNRPREQEEILRALVEATLLGREAALDGLRASAPPSNGPALDRHALLAKFNIEQAQKVLGAIIIAWSLDGASPKEQSSPLVLDYEVMARICARQMAEKEETSDFWDDVDYADLRLLQLASCPSMRIEGSDASPQSPAEYEARARAIADTYRVAMSISATRGQVDSIQTYVRFWYELSSFLLDRAHAADSEISTHWARLRRAMEVAGFPGIVVPQSSRIVATTAPTTTGAAAHRPVPTGNGVRRAKALAKASKAGKGSKISKSAKMPAKGATRNAAETTKAPATRRANRNGRGQGHSAPTR